MNNEIAVIKTTAGAQKVNASGLVNLPTIIACGEAVTFQQSLGVKFLFDNTIINAETPERLKYIETTVTS